MKQQKNRRAKRTVRWTVEGKGRRSSANLHPFPSPNFRSVRFAHPFFFFCFFPSLWSLVPGYIYSRRFINLYQEPIRLLFIQKNIEERCSGKEAYPQPSHGEKLSRENRVTPSRVNARVYGLKTLAPLPKPRADNNACACSDMPALIELTLLGETKCGKNCAGQESYLAIENVTSS